MAQQKTEEATPKKLQKAREKGEVAKSREVATAAVLLAAAGVLWATGPQVRQYLVSCFTLIFDTVERGAIAHPSTYLEASAILGVKAILPLLLVVMLAGGFSIFLQVGGLVSFKKIVPDIKRIDPVKGSKNLFTRRQVVELVKTILKIVIIGYVVWTTIADSLRGVTGLAAMNSAEATLGAAAQLVMSLLVRVGGAMVALAALDFIYQRWQFRQDQKMTKDEVKREHKESEGDPHLKQERSRVHREILEHATLEDMRRADVLVVNPTHYAVALTYDEELDDAAPEVVAKGQDHLARRMKEVAMQEGIPIMRDVPLAQSLFDLGIGTEIPEELYEAVAAVLHAAYKESRGESIDDE